METEQAQERDILEVNNLCETGNDFLFVSMETFKTKDGFYVQYNTIPFI